MPRPFSGRATMLSAALYWICSSRSSSPASARGAASVSVFDFFNVSPGRVCAFKGYQLKDINTQKKRTTLLCVDNVKPNRIILFNCFQKHTKLQYFAVLVLLL